MRPRIMPTNLSILRRPPSVTGSQDYRDAHARCPQCGSADIEQGFIFPAGDRDENTAWCLCGWAGIVHDLAPARRQ